MTDIYQVTATELRTRYGKFKGWRYDARFVDGRIEVARAKATRFYAHAFLFPGEVNGSATGGTLAARFLFGNRPTANTPIPAIATFNVQKA